MTAPRSRTLELAPPPAPEGDLGSRTDEELMRLTRMGHTEAFDVLVRRHSRWLVQLVAKLTADAGFAEEVTQDVWLSVWRGRSQYEAGNFRVYLITAARNRARNRARGIGRRTAAHAALAREPTHSAPDQLDELLARERRLEVLNALGSLRAEEREALVLRYGEDLDYETIVRITEIKPGTLRAQVHRAIAGLRARLSRGKAAVR